MVGCGDGCCALWSWREPRALVAPNSRTPPICSKEGSQESIAGANTVVETVNDSEDSTANGFASLPEPCAIEVQASNIAKYSLPEECLAFVPDDSAVVCKFGNGDSERMISCNTELSKQEQEWLQALQKEAARQQKSFIPSVSVAAARFLGDAGGDVAQALANMEENQAWRLNYLQKPLRDVELAEDLKAGAVYFCGRDFSLRPALVMRAGRVPFTWDPQRFARLFMFCVEYFLRYMAVPGRVENINVIIDLQDLSYGHMSLAPLMELKDVFTQQNAGRVFCFYVVNMPLLVRALASVVEAAMTQRARQKIRFLSDVAQLREDFALNQLEQDLSGTREPIGSFFPFPMPPGPFAAGSPGSNVGAAENLHRVMTAAGARGRLWDPLQSDQENRRIHFAPEARECLAQRGLAHLLEDQKAEVAQNEVQLAPVQSAQVELSPKEVSLRCIFSCEPLFKMGCQVAN